MVVAVAGEQVFHEVLVLAGDPGDAAAASALCPVFGHRLALDISEVGPCDNTFFLRDQIFNIHISGDRLDACPAIVAVLLDDLFHLFFNDRGQMGLIGQDILVISDLFVEIGQFAFDLFDFKPGQLSETVRDDGARLRIVKPELFHDSGLRFRDAAVGMADGVDNLVHDIDRAFQSFQNMSAFTRFAQIELRSSADDLFPELHEF